MIGKLKGRIEDIDDDAIILDVGGVGYHVFLSARALSALPGIGEALALTVETHVREDHIHLFGFPSREERDWFRLLMTVQGVGVKMALAILSVFAPAELATAIAIKDVKSLTRVSGVGAKLAERLTMELKNKVGAAPAALPPVVKGKGKGTALPPPDAREDAVSALVNLGYARAEAFTAVSQVMGTLDDPTRVDRLIQEGLKALARG